MTIKCDALQRISEEAEEAAANQAGGGGPETGDGGEDADAVRAAGGRGRFYMESKPSLGETPSVRHPR